MHIVRLLKKHMIMLHFRMMVASRAVGPQDSLIEDHNIGLAVSAIMPLDDSEMTMGGIVSLELLLSDKPECVRRSRSQSIQDEVWSASMSMSVCKATIKRAGSWY